MMQLLKIEPDHSNLHRYTLIHTCICYLSLLVVYSIFGYYSFVINRGGGMIAQYISYVIVNGGFALLTIQFQVFMYSMYIRFSALNGFVEWVCKLKARRVVDVGWIVLCIHKHCCQTKLDDFHILIPLHRPSMKNNKLKLFPLI